jgi:hypothetical protein
VHAELAVAEYVPAKQAVDAEAPVLPTKLPASASLQLDWPVASWYVPVAQSSHSLAPEPEKLPAGHAVCSEAPVLST